MWTTRAASVPEDFPRTEVRALELPGTSGPDGPLVVLVRRLSLLELADFKVPAGDDPAGLAAAAERVARAAVVKPEFDWTGTDSGRPSWPALPLAAQLEVVRRAAEWTTEGLEEVARVGAAFRANGGAGATDGVAGNGPAGVGEVGNAATPVAGHTAEPGGVGADSVATV